MEQRLYSIAELAEILKLHPKTILRFIHEGKIKARKIGRSWMVGFEELKEYAHAEFAVAETSRKAQLEAPDYA
ncbi:MAG: helix-turn-helix domain-containing protein, partial [Spirochaetes bacterium]|nr:helix-turn-helix domain-containing protein [Spirochaetota bacterium]